MYTMVVVLVVFGSPQANLSSGASSNIYSLDFTDQSKCQAAAAALAAATTKTSNIRANNMVLSATCVAR
jgi:hypothetical protein